MSDLSAAANMAIIAGAVVSSCGTLLAGVAAVGGWRTSLRNEIAVARANLQGAKNGEKIQEIHLQTNSMKDQLVAAVGINARKSGIEHEQQMQIARETQTALLVATLADPKSTAAQRSEAAALASRPVAVGLDEPAIVAQTPAAPIPVRIVAHAPVPVVQTPPIDTDALDALVIGQRTHDARSDARAEDVKATVTKKAL